MTKINAFYSIFVGIGMSLVWLILLLTNNVSELKTAPITIAFHIVVEYITALSLVASGILLLKKVSWAVYYNVFALGMLLYATINACGYYLQNSDIPMSVMFMFFITITMIITVLTLKTNK